MFFPCSDGFAQDRVRREAKRSDGEHRTAGMCRYFYYETGAVAHFLSVRGGSRKNVFEDARLLENGLNPKITLCLRNQTTQSFPEPLL